jgi:non-canonical (house-cleaning) NTP pyrophosphatase
VELENLWQFFLYFPPAQGKELGVAADELFAKSNCKHSNGAVGLLTQDLVTRPDIIVPSVLLAALPFLNKDLTFA